MSVVSFGRVNLIKVALLAIAVTLADCLVAFVGTTRPAGATFPGSNGKILFTKDGVGGAQDIYVMNADGTGQVNLTNSPENDAEPDWSPQLAESRDAAPLEAPPDGVRRSPQSSGHSMGHLRHVLQVGGGLPVLRATGRTVDLEDHPAGGGARLDQLERRVQAGVGEQPPALADDHGVGEQGELVD
jgi:hypothetical protein